MDFSYSEEEEAFRTEVRAFIRDHLPKRSGGEDQMDVEGGMADLPALFKWNQDLYAKRWVGFNWPREVGGGGGTISEQMILKEEMARVKAPMLGLSYMGLAWVGPALIKYGTRGAEGAAHRRRSCAARSSGAPATPSRAPAATWRRCNAKPSATATTTSSTARRSGPASRCGRSG